MTFKDVRDLMRHTSLETRLDYRRIFPGQLEQNFQIFDHLYGKHDDRKNLNDLNGQQSGQQKG